MEQKKLDQIIQTHFKWNRQSEAFELKPITMSCEDCGKMVTNRVVNCAMYYDRRFDNYFKHQCKNCKLVLFDGSKKSDCIRLKKARSGK